MADQFGLSDPFDTSPLYQAPMQQAFGAFPGGAPAAPAPAAPRPAGAAPAAAPKAPVAAAAPAAPAATAEDTARQKAMEMIQAGPSAGDITSAYEKYGKDVGAAQDEYLRGVEQRMQMIQDAAPLRQAAPQYQDFAKQVSPLAMIMMAFGGKAFGLTGQMMMGAATGMVEGTAAGNRERYEQSYQQWKDAYAQQQDHYNQVKDVMSQLDKLAQGNMQRKQQAAQTALEMIGVREDMAKQGLNAITGLDRTQADLAKKNADISAKHEQLEIARERLDIARGSADLKWEKAADAADAGMTSAQNLEKRLKKAKSLWDDIKKDPAVTSAMKAGAALDSNIVDRLLKVNKDKYAQLTQQLAGLTGAELGIVNAGLPASALRIKAVDLAELNATISLKGKTPAQVDSGFADFIDRTQETYEMQKRHYDRFSRSRGSAAPAEADLGKETKKPMPSGEKLKAYADAHYNGDINKAKEFLASQGYE